MADGRRGDGEMGPTTPSETGVVTISLDTEIGWGMINSGAYDGLERRLDNARAGIRRLLALFDEYRVPATWALVGQLFRDREADGPTVEYDLAPADVSIPWDRDWWRAPDVIDAISDSPVEHDIASHSGSHLVYEGAPRQAVTEDLSLFRSVAEEYEPVTSFVFPQNKVAHLDAVRDAGFTCYRGRPPRLGSDPIPTVFRPRQHDGLVNVPASTAFRHYGGRSFPLRYCPDGVKERLLRLGIKRAIRKGGVFHVVLHPIDFTLPSDRRLLDGLESFLAAIAEARDGSPVQVLTLSEIADRARS